MKNFIEKIKQTLTSHGFPEKKVTLPLEKMYQVAEEKKLNFNQVLDELVDMGIGHEKLADKILFFSLSDMPEHAEEEGRDQQQLFADLMNRFQGMDPKEMMKNPLEILGKMKPEELQAIKEMYKKLSASEREQILKQAKESGL